LSGAPSVHAAPPSAANSAAAMQDFREVNSSAPVHGAAPSAANSAAAMQDFRDVNGPSVSEAPAAAPAQHAKAESAWIVHARAYNNQSGTSAEFNSLTGGACATDDGMQLDPNKVAQWQADHGVAPDGRVGPHTLAKARTLASAAPPAAPATVAATPSDPAMDPAPQQAPTPVASVDPSILEELE
jgi:hypothetical protein